MAKTFGMLVLGTTLIWHMVVPTFAQLPGGLPWSEAVDPDTGAVLPNAATPQRPTPAELPAPSDGLEVPLDLDELKLQDPSEGDLALEPIPTEYEGWDFLPAFTASSGTWLRRGFWYTEVDAVIFNRYWNRRELTYAIDIGGGIISAQDTLRTLDLDGTKPGAEGNARFTLGRFLFRDTCNRDHSVEFTAFGGGQFLQEANITSRFPSAQRLNVPFEIDLNNLSFDGADSMDINYVSRFNSFETNYRVRNRMTRDRMIMDPSGHWVRQANPTIVSEYLVGLRYFDLIERVRWNAFDFDGAADTSGFYDIDTDNDMFGFQLGGGFTYEHGRWSAGISTKLGVYLNDVTSNTAFARTDMPNNDFTTDSRNTTFSFINQSDVTLRWYMRPNLSLKAGWEMMYVTSVALAPHQINFRPDENQVVYTGDPFYNGAVFGFEGFW